MTAVMEAPATPTDAERRERWLADRRTVITGTDAAKVLRCSPFGGPIDVYADKLGMFEEGPSNPQQRRGKRRERLVLDAYADAEPCELIFADPFALIRSPNGYPIGATLDARRADDGRPVEAKTCRFPGIEWGPDGTDQTPMHYGVQVAIEMHVCDTESGDLPVEFGGEEYACYRFHRNHKTEEAMLAILMEFREKHVLAELPPPIDGSESYTEFLKLAYPSSADVELIASPEQEARARKFFAAKAELKEAAARAELLKQAFMQEMGLAKRLNGSGWRIRYSQNKDGESVAFEGVARNLAQVLNDVTASSIGSETFLRQTKAHTTIKPGARPFFLEVTK
jgi:predicted phage-related endonuclease